MAVASVPPPPARLSTTTCCPQVSVIFVATLRARRSVALPAVNGMMRRTGLVGKSCGACPAGTDDAASASAIAVAVADVALCKEGMGLLLIETNAQVT